ncbi:hypothetical protein AAC691_21080 [Nguyenibacter vanlangensis]|uniref:Uncharacterized protein n=1 Tax=Nguyenibacter vanlangensis TaxID=1216886 RepID=A0A7Y7M5H1_9PROT|nr:hypothetical protein [Nguyenibacter vanlangensis]NVN11017.1 hypothetical protein [Nguyenibacter vanlangensis]
MGPVNPWSKPDRSIGAILDVPAKAFARRLEWIAGPFLAEIQDTKPDPASIRYRWRPAVILLLTFVDLAWLSNSPRLSPALFLYVELGLSLWSSRLVYKIMLVTGPVYEQDERQRALAAAAREKGLIGALLLTYSGLIELLYQLLRAARFRVDSVLPYLAIEIAVLLTATTVVYQCIRLLYLSWAEQPIPDLE